MTISDNLLCYMLCSSYVRPLIRLAGTEHQKQQNWASSSFAVAVTDSANILLHRRDAILFVIALGDAYLFSVLDKPGDNVVANATSEAVFFNDSCQGYDHFCEI